MESVRARLPARSRALRRRNRRQLPRDAPRGLPACVRSARPWRSAAPPAPGRCDASRAGVRVVREAECLLSRTTREPCRARPGWERTPRVALPRFVLASDFRSEQHPTFAAAPARPAKRHSDCGHVVLTHSAPGQPSTKCFGRSIGPARSQWAKKVWRAGNTPHEPNIGVSAHWEALCDGSAR
jgi:hypothetical protein